MCDLENLVNEEAMDHWGAIAPKTNKPTWCNKDFFLNPLNMFLHLTGSYFLDVPHKYILVTLIMP